MSCPLRDSNQDQVHSHPLMHQHFPKDTVPTPTGEKKRTCALARPQLPWCSLALRITRMSRVSVARHSPLAYVNGLLNGPEARYLECGLLISYDSF